LERGELLDIHVAVSVQEWSPRLSGPGVFLEPVFLGLSALTNSTPVPPRVEYELTPLGKDMLAALEGFTLWIRRNWPKIIDARKTFDAGDRNIA
jgi:hypothetical protein